MSVITENPPLHVAVGVIKNAAGEILLSQRSKAAHQGGLWEFAGGKLEARETAPQALARELQEELGITIQSITPLITVNHHYPDLSVCLHVFLVTQFSGEVTNREQQPLQWLKPSDLHKLQFPAANQPIICAAQLPPFYAILDDNEADLIIHKLKTLLSNGITLIQARLKRLSADAVKNFLIQAQALCADYGASLLLNSDVAGIDNLTVEGLHLTSSALLALKQRPQGYRWLAASCHNLKELQHAQAIGVDFVVIAPVLATPTHPQTLPLGWQAFSELVAQTNLPSYALGGLSKADLSVVQHAGAQGIAAIRAFL
ncbi:MAG: Nudix family hydrolase [Methylococcaceae bacterium]